MTSIGGGLKSGMRGAQPDMTRSLDDRVATGIMRGSSRNALRFKKVHGFWMHALFVILGLALFFCAVHFVVDMVWPGQIRRTMAPILPNINKLMGQTAEKKQAEKPAQQGKQTPKKMKNKKKGKSG